MELPRPACLSREPRSERPPAGALYFSKLCIARIDLCQRRRGLTTKAAGSGVLAALLTGLGWALQIVGHQFFERRRPALLDNPIHMLISPMYLFAKLFVALGFRRDLAPLLEKSSA
jgi:uncharacterized membrane protein YGL010W